jgi:hypothetical protein
MLPAIVIVTTPPHAQVQVEPLTRAGWPPIFIVADPGTQGPTTAGMHGIGVRTPRAALVAAATLGFESEVHMPNGGMFTLGAVEVTTAAGRPSMRTRLVGNAFRVAGASPKLHCSSAPLTAHWPILASLPGGNPYFLVSLTEDESF